MRTKRTVVFWLTLVLAAVIHTGVAEAQFSHATCRAEAPNSPIRAEGLAERTGDLRIACQPTVGFFFILPQQVITELNMTLELNVSVGNHVNVYGVPGLTDAVLTINQQDAYHPLPDSQSDYAVWLGGVVGVNEPPLDPPILSECPSFLSLGIATPPFDDAFFDPRWPCPQLATLGGPNRLVFNGVKAPFPGVDAAAAGFPFDVVPSFPEVTVFEIHNIRANASELGVTEASNPGGAFVVARITIDPGSSFSLVNSVMTIATPLVGLLPTVSAPVTGLQCADNAKHVTINLQEGFASAFKTLGAPTFEQSSQGVWENGYPVLGDDTGIATEIFGGSPGITFPFADSFTAPGQNTGTGGGATQGTRFMIRLREVQPGVTVEVPAVVNNDGGESGCQSTPLIFGELCLYLVTGTDANGAGGVGSGLGPGETYPVPIGSDGTGFVVYEVGDGDPFELEDIDVDVWFSWAYIPDDDEPGIGTASVDVRFAPLSDVAGASNEPVPRFVDIGDDPVPVLTIQRCATTLLFPFVSNRAGFDTGISIANTSMDWKGTSPQAGRCMLHYIGNTGQDGPMPDDDLTTVIEGGETLLFTLSQGNPAREVNGAPNFQGFMVAMCEFQYAHGFAFMNDGGGGVPNWSQGYLALVMRFDEEGQRSIPRGVFGVEQLGQ